MAVFETWLKSDLKKPVTVQKLSGNLFSADNGGNLIGVEVMNNGSPATLTGGVTGYIIRDDNSTVTVTGTLSGNKASIVLPSSAYVVVGKVSIVVKVGTTTVGACVGYVYRTTTDTLVDPGHVIPSIEELLAQIENCRQATTNANTAASSANSAASNANTKATLADQKATLADQKATLANTAAGTANTAATSANTAAGNANTAASKIDNMTVSASGLSAGSTPTATISEVSGHKHIAFGLVKGDKGDTGDKGKDFHIAKTFSSVSAMMNYTGTDIEAFDFAMIDTGSVQDPDTGKLYCYEPDKTPKWQYIGDLSGAQGIKGETGTGIDHITLNQDYTLTIYLDDGTDYTTASIRGATGITPAISVGTVATLQPSQSAYVQLDQSSTPEAPVFNFGIPKGDTGTAENVYGSTIPMSPQDSTKISEAIAGKVNANQGAGNAGKALGIDNTGAVVPVPFSGDDFTGATASTAGVHGYVPAPAAGDQGKFLRGDGTWTNVPNPQVMTGATSSAAGASGLVPAPSAGDQDKVLTGAGTWADQAGSRLMVVTLDAVTNTSGSYTHTTTVSGMTGDLKAVKLECSDPTIFRAPVSIVTGADSVTLTCSNVVGSSTVKASFLAVGNGNPLSSSEYAALDTRIGQLADLDTTDKTDIVSAINEVDRKLNSIVKSKTVSVTTNSSGSAFLAASDFDPQKDHILYGTNADGYLVSISATTVSGTLLYKLKLWDTINGTTFQVGANLTRNVTFYYI